MLQLEAHFGQRCHQVHLGSVRNSDHAIFFLHFGFGGEGEREEEVSQYPVWGLSLVSARIRSCKIKWFCQEFDILASSAIAN
jgi:hypothetical protein